MTNLLFVCLHNAGRSQMSAALFERAAGGRHEARSAGTTPAGVRYVDWDLPDPKGQPLEAVRATRDEIEDRVAALLAELDRD